MGLYDHRCKVGKVKNGVLYFSNWDNSGLFKVDLNTMAPEFVSFFENEPSRTWLHRSSFCFDDWIGFTPDRGRAINLYNIKTKEAKNIDINPHVNNGPFIEKSFVYNRMLWMIPCLAMGSNRYDYFYSLNLDTFEINEHRFINDYIYQEIRMTNDVYIWGACLDRNILICPIAKSNIILKVNLDSFDISHQYVDFYGIRGIFKGKDGFWLTQHVENKIGFWDGISERVVEYSTGVEVKRQIPFSNIITTANNNVYCIPGSTEKILKLTKDNVFKEIGNFPKEIEFLDINRDKFYEVEKYMDNWLLLPYNANGVVILNDKTEEISFMRFADESRISKEKYEKRFIEEDLKSVVEEGTALSLNEYIGFVADMC